MNDRSYARLLCLAILALALVLTGYVRAHGALTHQGRKGF